MKELAAPKPAAGHGRPAQPSGGVIMLWGCVSITTLIFCASPLPSSPLWQEIDHGLDQAKINAAIQWIEREAPYLHTFIVQHDGKTVTENHFHQAGAKVPHDLQSATKTVTGVLIGIAIDQGIVRSLDQPLIELLPDHRDYLKGKKATITVRHLLEMTSGLRWIDFGAERSFEKQARASDSVAFILGEPLLSPPGQKWAYNTGSSHLLSAIIHVNTEGSTAEFAQTHLFGPLECSSYVWRQHQDGIHEGGWRLSLCPSDMVKIGQMILDGGQWKEKRIVSKAYIDEATSFKHPTDRGESGYGFQMWIERDYGCSDLAGAKGWGGQNIFIAQDLRTVIVSTGSIYHPGEMEYAIKKLICDYIAPAHR